MAKIIKSCDFSKSVAVKVFEMLNPESVHLEENQILFGTVIVTDVAPKDLTYPEGWYYAKGCFRNKHTSSTGIYDEVVMMKSNGQYWGAIATYCTLE